MPLTVRSSIDSIEFKGPRKNYALSRITYCQESFLLFRVGISPGSEEKLRSEHPDLHMSQKIVIRPTKSGLLAEMSFQGSINNIIKYSSEKPEKVVVF